MFLGYAGFDHFYLEWICLVPVLWAIRDQRPGRAFLIGWLAGMAMNCGGFCWAIQMFRQFAEAPLTLAILGLLLLAAANGVVVAAWAWGTRLITLNSRWSVAWVSPVLWTALEKFWPELFPNYLGASQYQLSSVTQIAELTGILGVTFLVVYLNSTIYALLELRGGNRRLSLRLALSLAVVLALVLAYGHVRIRAVEREAAAADTLTIALIQANRGAGDKRQHFASLLGDHGEMSRAVAASSHPDLIVWPESVTSVRLMSRSGTLPSDALGDAHTPILFGAVLQLNEENGERFSNSALLADVSGQLLGVYDKMVLVPLGEYIPLGETFPQLYSLAPTVGRFSAGESFAPLQFGKYLLSVDICYEDIFPSQIRSLMRGGSGGRVPDVMINLSNDSWYGKVIEPVEHLALASFRAIEHRRALVRSTNTGVSAFVDPVGRIVMRSGFWTRETVVGRVAIMKQGATFYARFGDWLGWLCALLSLVGIGQALAASRRGSRVVTLPLPGKKRRRG